MDVASMRRIVLMLILQNFWGGRGGVLVVAAMIVVSAARKKEEPTAVTDWSRSADLSGRWMLQRARDTINANQSQPIHIIASANLMR